MTRRRKRDKDLEAIVSTFSAMVVLSLVYVWNNYRTQLYIFGAVVVIIAATGIYFIYKLKKKRFDNFYSGKDLLSRLRSMHPAEFEEYITDLYRRLGYKTEKVGRSHDHGIDVIADKDGIRHYIQCKKYITSKVGEPEIRNFVGSLTGKLARGKGMFITTNIFTEEAEQWAKDQPIELIDGNELIRLIKIASKEQGDLLVKEVESEQSGIITAAINETSTVSNEENICSLCGGKLILRTARKGPNAGHQFYGCSNYPRCKFIKN
ncbi:MAG: restriction endonuclease [Candidatus Falkowbacteria bacterium]